MTDEIKELLTSPDPETNFLGLMILKEENNLDNIQDFNILRNCMINLNNYHTDFFKEKMNIISEIFEQTIFNLTKNVKIKKSEGNKTDIVVRRIARKTTRKTN